MTEESPKPCNCTSKDVLTKDATQYWVDHVCQLLAEVDSIERHILRRDPTSATLRKIGKREYLRMRKEFAAQSQS